MIRYWATAAQLSLNALKVGCVAHLLVQTSTSDLLSTTTEREIILCYQSERLDTVGYEEENENENRIRYKLPFKGFIHFAGSDRKGISEQEAPSTVSY